MPKNWPEFKSWKKPKRKKLAKINVASRWGRRNKSGDLYNRCRVEISWNDKKGPRGPRHCAFFIATAKRGWIKGNSWLAFYTYERVYCRLCFRKEIKEALIFWVKFLIFLVVFGILLFLINEFLVKS